MRILLIALFLLYSGRKVSGFTKLTFGSRAVMAGSSALRSQVPQEEAPTPASPEVNIEEETKKYGFEVGMFKSLTNKDTATMKPGDLLKKYGTAYLVTSISLALVSFAICYALVSQGVDVAALLKQVGIEVSSTTENVGTAGLAYIVHKAASPIRFPPTVALTPVVANCLGRKENESGAM